MSVTYGFYNSSNGDRKYNALQFGSIFDGIILDGVFEKLGDHFQVTPVPGTLAVYIGTGRAWFDHTWTLNDANYQVTLTASNLVLPRIDAIVLEVNESTRTNSFKSITGTASSDPKKPTLTNNQDVHQYALAYVTVPEGATTVSQSNIENRVGLDDCPFVTGPLEAMNINQIVAQWQAMFQNWFENLGEILNDNAAGNLQNELEQYMPMLVEATFSLNNWNSTSSYGCNYYQTASVSKVYAGGGALSSNSKLIGPATTDQVSNASTRSMLLDSLSAINNGYMSSFTGTSVTIYVEDVPNSDITCYWIAQRNPN